jgi:uncharacterized membrane protein (UPF0127 family)
MTTVRIRFWAAFAIIVVMWGMLAAASRAEGPETLQIVTSSGTHEFHVEIAKDDATRAQGLMNRPFLPADRGMLFEFDREAPVSFWMKNTYIPLDMIFISRAGVVTNIVEKAEPLSERVIPSGPPCMAVLELNGGAAASIGLKVGDKVRHPFFKP